MEKDMDSIQGTPTRTFRHQRLDTTTEQIRLFRILPRERDRDPIRGILQKFDIQSSPPFIALSYTWGPERLKQFISIDESSFEIRENLWHFLSVYEALDQGDSRQHIPNGLECGALKASFLWIDQICIDQSQVAERSHQVHLMGEIYRRAKEVIAWIPDVSDALKQLRTGGVGILPPSYFYIQKLFRAPYWTRVWIQQEVMLARQLIIMSSADSGTWLVLWEEVAQAVSSQPPRENSLQSFDPLRMPMEHDPPILKALLQYRGSGMLRDGFHLLEALSNFDICACSDPKDHVYGLLGIVHPEERVRIDYNLNIEEVWRSAFTMVVQSQEKDPDDEIIDFLALKINLHSHLDHETVQQFVKSLQSQQWSQATTTSSQRSVQANSVPRVMIFKD
jgi:hypothetical protein